MGGKRSSNVQRDDTGVGIASEPPQLTPGPLTRTDNHVDEKAAVALSDREFRLPSRSSSTISRFVDRLGNSVYGLSSLRAIPSWRNTFPRAHGRYAEIERGHDVGGLGGSASGSDIPSLPRLHGGAPPPSRHSSSGNLRNPSLRHRRRHAVKRTRNQNNVFFRTPISDLLTGFSHAMTISTGGHRDSGTTSNSNSSSSLGTHQYYSSSFDSSGSGSHIPFPSMSDESNRTFPSPYSADAAAAFQNKSDAPHLFDGHVKFRGIFEDHMQVVFGDAAASNNMTSTASASTSSGATSARTASKPAGLLVRSRRRVSALARAVKPARRKFLSIFDKKLPPRPADDDDDPVEYDIPCLAYVTCLW